MLLAGSPTSEKQTIIDWLQQIALRDGSLYVT